MSRRLAEQPLDRIVVVFLVGAAAVGVGALLRAFDHRSVLGWVSIGIASGVLLRWGTSLWLPLFAGAASLSILLGEGLSPSLMAAAGTLSGPWLLATVLGRSSFRTDFSGPRDALRFGAAAMAVMTVPPTIVLGALEWLGRGSSLVPAGPRWVHWWAHATIATLLVAPVVATLTAATPRAWLQRARTALGLLAALALYVVATLLLPRSAIGLWVAPLGLIVVLYSAMRMDLAFTSLLGLGFVTASSLNVSDDSPVWTFAIILAATSLLVHALLAEHIQVERALDDTEARHRADLLEAASREQQRIGRDVHDTIGQELTALSLMARAIEIESRTGAPQVAAQARAVLEDCGRAVQSARALSRGLLASVDDVDHLAVALRALGEPGAGTERLRLEVAIDGGLELPARTCLNLYRIAEEAVGRASRRLQSTWVRIRIERAGAVVRLEISSDGQDRGTRSDPADLWLRTMQYRAEITGGHLEVRTAADGTHRVACELPVEVNRFPTGEVVQA